MAGLGGFSASDLKKLQKELSKLQQNQQTFVESCIKELAARLLAKVVKRTPVGDYPAGSGKLGGTLRRGWTAQTHEEAAAGSGKSSQQAAREYARSLPIQQEGDRLMVTILNPVEYASYVEYGHRTAGHKGWVPGRFMLSLSVRELEEIAPRVLEARLKKAMGGLWK